MPPIRPALLMALLLAPVPATAQAIDWTEVDSSVVREMRAQSVPGASLAVLVGDSVVYARGYGVVSVETAQPVGAETVFRVASVSKMFTGLEGSILASRGLVDLDAPVSRYLDGLAPEIGRLTLRALLSHTAGLRDQSGASGPRDEEALGRAARRLGAGDLFAEPGDAFSYANPGFTLAGAVLEGAARIPFADLLRRDVLAPLGMRRSTFRILEAVTFPNALGHSQGENGPEVMRPAFDNAEVLPRGGLFSAATELARFAAAMSGGWPGADSVAVRLAETPVASISAADPRVRYGLGIRVVETPAGIELGHYGGGGGFGAVVRMIPSRRVAVVLLANRESAALDRTVNLLLSRLTGQVIGARRPAPVRPERADNRLAGVYRNNDGASLELRASPGGLVLWDDEEATPLYALSPDSVVILSEAGEVEAQFIFARGARSGRSYLSFMSRAFFREP